MKGRCVPAAFVSVGLVAAQSIGLDEIHTQAFAYVPPLAVTLSTQVRQVDVPVVVRDAKRHAVAGLTRHDFEIYDAGKKQTITAFSAQSFAPAGGHGGLGREHLRPARRRRDLWRWCSTICISTRLR